MRVKGMVFLARRRLVVDKVGEETWNQFLKDFAAEVPTFAAPIMPTSTLPLKDMLQLQDAIVRRFFNNNVKAHWEMGAGSAQWSLTSGPYRALLQQNIDTFVSIGLPTIWANYYTAGRIVGTLDKKTVHIKVVELPFWHIGYELMVMGYFQRALELKAGRQVVSNRIVGGSPGSEIHYEFLL